MNSFDAYLDTYFESVLSDPRLVAALDEFRERISERYPEATFAVERSLEPIGVYLVVTVDVEDTSEVHHLVIDRMIDLQIEESMPLYVSVERPLARVLEELSRQRAAPVGALPPTG